MQRSNREADSTTSPVCDPLWPGAGTWAKVIPSQYLSETLRAVRRAQNCGWALASREKRSSSGPPASWRRRAAPGVSAPLRATRRTSAEPLDARAPPARARHPRAAPALFAAARGAGRRAPLSRHLATQRPRPARGRLPSLPAGAAASGRPRDGAASAQRAGRSRSRPALLIGGRSLPAGSAGSALRGAGRPELGLGRRLRGLGVRGDAASLPSVWTPPPPPVWSAGPREVSAPT